MKVFSVAQWLAASTIRITEEFVVVPKQKGMINEVCYLAHSGFLTPHLLVQAVILPKECQGEGDSERKDEELRCWKKNILSHVLHFFRDEAQRLL